MDGFVASKASLGSMRPGERVDPQEVVDVGGWGRDMVCHGMSEKFRGIY